MADRGPPRNFNSSYFHGNMNLNDDQRTPSSHYDDIVARQTNSTGASNRSSNNDIPHASRRSFQDSLRPVYDPDSSYCPPAPLSSSTPILQPHPPPYIKKSHSPPPLTPSPTQPFSPSSSPPASSSPPPAPSAPMSTSMPSLAPHGTPVPPLLVGQSFPPQPSSISSQTHQIRAPTQNRHVNDLKNALARLNELLNSRCKEIGEIERSRKRCFGSLEKQRLTEKLNEKRRIEERIDSIKKQLIKLNETKALNRDKDSKKESESDEEISDPPVAPVTVREMPMVDASTQCSIVNVKNDVYDHVDGGKHLCVKCGEFFNTAPSFLRHLFSQSHLQKIEFENDVWISKPQVEAKDVYTRGDAQAFKGSELIFPATEAYYCSVCKEMLGSLKETELHLRTSKHNQAYNKYLSNNEKYAQKWSLEMTKATMRQSRKDKKKFREDDDRKEKEARKRARESEGERKKKDRSGYHRDSNEENHIKKIRESEDDTKSAKIDSDILRNLKLRNSSSDVNKKCEKSSRDDKKRPNGLEPVSTKPLQMTYELDDLLQPQIPFKDHKLAQRNFVSIPYRDQQRAYKRHLKQMLIESKRKSKRSSNDGSASYSGGLSHSEAAASMLSDSFAMKTDGEMSVMSNPLMIDTSAEENDQDMSLLVSEISANLRDEEDGNEDKNDSLIDLNLRDDDSDRSTADGPVLSDKSLSESHGDTAGDVRVQPSTLVEITKETSLLDWPQSMSACENDKFHNDEANLNHVELLSTIEQMCNELIADKSTN